MSTNRPIVFLTGLLGVSLTLLGVAGWQWHRANVQTEIAREQTKKAEDMAVAEAKRGRSGTLGEGPDQDRGISSPGGLVGCGEARTARPRDAAGLGSREAGRHPRSSGEPATLLSMRVRKSFASSTSPRAMSRAWPSGRRARSPRDMASRRPRRRRQRRGALRRPGRAAPTRPAGGQGGRGQERGLRAGGQDRRGIWRRGGGGGVVLFDARGERLRPAPLEVKEGGVTSVAFGPEGQIAAGYASAPAAAAAWCSSTPGASGSDPRRWRSRRAMSRAWPSGRRADRRGIWRRRPRRRRGALRRPGRAAPTRPAGGQGGRCQERGLRAGGPDRRGIWHRRRRPRRRGALRRPGRAAPTRAAGGQGGQCHERGLRAGGQDRRGI